jgi:hypothetical protein
MSIEAELLTIKGNREFWVCEEIVDWARAHPNSALHKAPQFCGFDLQKSAYQHWLWAARALIALHITYEDGTRKAVSLSIDRTRKGGGYRDVDDVLRDKSLYDIMLADALSELKRVELKYDQVKQLKPVWRMAAKIRQSREAKGKGGREHRASA